MILAETLVNIDQQPQAYIRHDGTLGVESSNAETMTDPQEYYYHHKSNEMIRVEEQREQSSIFIELLETGPAMEENNTTESLVENTKTHDTLVVQDIPEDDLEAPPPSTSTTSVAQEGTALVQEEQPLIVGGNDLTYENEDENNDNDDELSIRSYFMGSQSHHAIVYHYDDYSTSHNHNHNQHNNHRGNNTMVPASNTSNDEREFLTAVRFCIYLGKAAFRYGSPGSKVEIFLQRLLEDRFGYYSGLFRATQSEFMCSVCQGEDDPPRTFLVALEPGLNLHKLGLLADLVDRVVGAPLTRNNPNEEEEEEEEQQQQHQPLTSLVDALAELKEIESTPDPWNKWAVASSFPIVGGGLSMVLGGTWWDALVGSVLGIVGYAIMEGLPHVGSRGRFAQWVPLFCAFAVSTLATIAKRVWLPQLHVTLVTLSAIAILLPGYTVSMGIGELVSNRIISGAANLIGGMVTMFWLVIGAWLGDAFGSSLTGGLNLAIEEQTFTTNSYSTDDRGVPLPWQALFVPLLCLSLIAAFQVSHRDMWWCLAHLLLTYLIFLATGLVMESTQSPNDGGNDEDTASSVLSSGGKNLRIYLSTVVSCVAANAWATRTNRPNSILLVPALVFLVSGSIGFQGLLTILLVDDEETKSVGTEQFLQMIIVALLIVAGLLTGNTLLEPSTTL